MKSQRLGPPLLGAVVTEGCFLLSLLLAIMPLGAVYPAPLLASAILAGISLALGALLYRPTSRWIIAAVAVATVAGVLSAGFVVFQSYCPTYPEWESRFWTLLSPLGGTRCATVSAIGPGSLLALPQLLAPIALFVAGLFICSSAHAARRQLRVLAVVGAIFALVGLINFLAFPDTLLLFKKMAYLDSLTGFFVNRNSAATFLGIALILATLWGIRHGDLDFGPRLRQIIPPVVVVLVIATALMLTKSRAGIASSVLGLGLFAALNAGWLVRSLARRARVPVGWAAVGVAAIVLIALTAVASASFYRIALGVNDDPRVCIYAAVARGVGAGWPFGHGLGSFAMTFPTFRTPDCGISGIWEMAHNVYLEAAYTMGLFGIVLVVIAIGLATVPAIGHLFTRDWRRLPSTAALSIVVLVMAHSAIDFSVEIPGVAAYLTATAAVLLGLTTSPERTA